MHVALICMLHSHVWIRSVNMERERERERERETRRGRLFSCPRNPIRRESERARTVTCLASLAVSCYATLCYYRCLLPSEFSIHVREFGARTVYYYPGYLLPIRMAILIDPAGVQD